ncbi:MAG: prepilin-type N-terminal cleavage/methylation domain-containing protein [Verrucomicrobiota bacterium]
MDIPTLPIRPSLCPLQKRSGFTLIELLTVIAIIGILAAIIVPILGGVRERSNGAKSTSNLRQMGAALSLSVNDHPPQASIIGDGRFPAAWGTYGADGGWGDFGWYDVLAARLDLAVLERTGNKAYKWTSTPHKTIFQDPGKEVDFDPYNAEVTSSYGYNRPGIGDGAVHPSSEIRDADEGEGPIKVINITNPAKFVVIAESNGDGAFETTTWVGQGWPTAGAPSHYNGGGHYLFADGHVQWMSKDEVEENPQEFFSR